MPMLPYPPATKPDAAEHSLLRVLGGVLAFLSLLLTLLSIILHQRVPDLILALIVGMFALRVLILWLGDKPQHQQPSAVWSSMDPVRYPLQSPAYTPGQPAPSASLYSQSQPLSRLAPEQHMPQSVPLPPTVVAPPPPQLPRSIRPQQPPSLWLPPPSTSVPLPSPAPVPRPSQQGNWPYDDGKNLTQQQRGNDHGTA